VTETDRRWWFRFGMYVLASAFVAIVYTWWYEALELRYMQWVAVPALIGSMGVVPIAVGMLEWLIFGPKE
jgi:hypothetical protein